MRVAVIGAGAMGHGVAQISAMAGLDVSLIDINEELLAKGMDKIKASLGKLVEKKRISKENADATISKIRTTTNLEEGVKDVDFVIEAVPEKMDLKKEIFAKIDKVASKDAIFATNTSSLSITEMSEATSRPDRFVGMHFFNPPQLMPLVEVIKGLHTSDEVTGKTAELAKKLGKMPVICKKDVRGFIVNRILHSITNEAAWAVYRGEAKVEEVDAAAKFKAELPMGVFELQDFVGIDVSCEVGKVIGKAYEHAKPCPIFEEYVKEGKLGMKTGKGFYDTWPKRPRTPFILLDEFDVKRLYAAAVNEASRLIHEGVADPADIDKAVRLGLNWPRGPCEIGDREGLDVMLEKLKELFDKHKEKTYEPCPLLVEYVSKGWFGKKTKKGFYAY